jgi:hypothetical protein
MKGEIEIGDMSNHTPNNCINQKKMISKFITFDHENASITHDNCTINDGAKVGKSFEYNLGKKNQ